MIAYEKCECNDLFFLLADLGVQEHRLEGEEYLAVIDEFMEAVYTRWPHVIVQVSFFMLLISADAKHCETCCFSVAFSPYHHLMLSILQFEDFQTKWAFKLLQRYRHNYRMFNDDVQV